MDKDIEAGERNLEYHRKGLLHLATGKAVITPDFNWLHVLRRLERTAKELAATDIPIVEMVKRPHSHGYKVTRLGRALHSLCVEVPPLAQRNGHGFTLLSRSFQKKDGSIGGGIEGLPYTAIDVITNPHITVMLRACLGVSKTLGGAGDRWDVANNQRVRAAYEQAARLVRRVCRSSAFKNVVSNHRRRANKNLQSCLKYVRRLFEHHSKLLVLRVDLYVHSENYAWSATCRAERCMGRYLRALREDRLLEPEVKGWIVKREGGVYRGIHFHLMVFLDGHKHQQGYAYSQRLGEAWQNRYSDGKGSFFNCWTRRKEYPFNALGVVHVSDEHMLMGVRGALGYMTKEDCALETGRTRNLRKGVMPAPVGDTKPGAPRKSKHDMSVVTRVFDGGK